MSESRAVAYPPHILEAIQPSVDAAYESHVASNPRGEQLSLNPYEVVKLEDYPLLKADYQAHLERWAEQGIDIAPIIRAVMLVDAATEDNLPWYTAQIAAGFESWQLWNGRWTAEEHSHGEIMLRDIEARGVVDMASIWQPIREHNNNAGMHVQITSPADGIAYVSVQELLTRKAHFASSKVIDQEAAKSLKAIAADEGRHYSFYVKQLAAIAQVEPDYALAAMRRQHEGRNFNMPGKEGIPGYDSFAATIALGGLFDIVTILEAQRQTIHDAKLMQLKPTTDQGKADQEWAANIADDTSRLWNRKQRAANMLREKAASVLVNEGDHLQPFILGATVELVAGKYRPMS